MNDSVEPGKRPRIPEIMKQSETYIKVLGDRRGTRCVHVDVPNAQALQVTGIRTENAIEARERHEETETNKEKPAHG